MKTVLFILAWIMLCAICWPLAVLAIVMLPLLWLLALPFRLIGITLDAVLALVRAILFLPARLLGHRDKPAGRAF